MGMGTAATSTSSGEAVAVILRQRNPARDTVYGDDFFTEVEAQRQK